MRVFWYTFWIMFAPTLAYAIYWLNFHSIKDHTSQVSPWIVLFLGVGLFFFTVYLVIVKSHEFKKLGIGGQEQHPSDHH